MTATESRKHQRERDILVPYASFSSDSKGRKHEDVPSPARTCFQRDRDRILHSAAFRRMEYKTQVFVNHEGDHYRTRLTHSLEVAQIGRTVGRALELNEDLIEALVLVHDVGHTPFGHAGERAMKELMKNHGGFEHNSQSLRIVDVLEHRYPHFPGLNLSFEVREGIIKHSGHWKAEDVPAELLPNEYPGLEAQLIDLVDEIAYNNHDVDDGLSSEMISIRDLKEVRLWQEAQNKVAQTYGDLSWPEAKYPTISAMISILVGDLIAQTRKNIEASGVKNVEDIRKLDHSLVALSKEVAEWNQELKGFLWNRLYTHYRVVRMEEKAKRVIVDLFNTFMDRPEQIPTEFRSRYEKEEKARMICDYIAGMTDRFAVEEHEKLFDAKRRV